MIICKDNNGICDKSKLNICCINCSQFTECKQLRCICPTMRYQNTEELIVENCIFSNKVIDMSKVLRTCRNCYYYSNCTEWNDNNICNDHLTDEESKEIK